jgi:hypothetical protein
MNQSLRSNASNVCAIIHMPTCPLRFDDLRPDAELATLAGIARGYGHRPKIIDLCTVETFEELEAVCATRPSPLPDHVAYAGQTDDSETTTVPFASPIEQEQWLQHDGARAMYYEIAESVASLGETGTAWLKIVGLSNLRSSVRIANRLRALRPSWDIRAFGSALGDLAEIDGFSPEPFNGLHCGSFERISREFAWAMGQGSTCGAIGDAITTGPRATPLYDADTYPALHEQTKLQIFDVPLPRVDAIWDRGRVRDRVWETVEFINYLAGQHGTHAFHLGGNPSTDLLEEAGEAISRGNPEVRYTCQAPITAMSALAFQRLKKSGCLGVSMRLESGSQRLMDDVYRREVSISEAEEVMTSARFNGLHCGLHMVFPHLEDDYHTGAESLRFIHRTKPHCVSLELPSPFGAFTNRSGYACQPHSIEEVARLGDENFGIRPSPRLEVERHHELEAQIRALGIATKASPRTALYAHVAGYGGREKKFSRIVERAMRAPHTGEIFALVERINRRVSTPSNTITFKPFEPYRNVVGN